MHHHHGRIEQIRITSERGGFHYSAGLVTLLLVALVAIVGLMLFTVVPLFTR